MNEAQKTHKEAIKLIHKKQYEPALSMLEKLPQTIEIRNDIAVCCYMLGNFSKAIALLEEILAEKKHYPPALINHKYIQLALKCEIKSPAFEIEEKWSKELGTPLISVIIPTYDRPQFLKEAILSVLAQSFQDFEIIVVNDGGPDEAKQIVFQLNNQRVRYIKIKHRGISGALNAGLAHSKGKYVAYLDDDDVYLPNHLRNLFEVFEAHPSVYFAYSSSFRCLQKPRNDEWITYKKYVVGGQNFDRAKLEKANFIQTTGCVMHRRELVFEVGGFNEEIIGCQDWDFYLRATKNRHVCFSNQPTVEHRIREKTGSQLSGNYLIMRRNVCVTQYLHKLLGVLSARYDERSYHIALEYIARLVTKSDSVLDILDLYELTYRKPYACFFRLGKDFSQVGDKKSAREAFLLAFKLSPWETKVWGKIFRP